MSFPIEENSLHMALNLYLSSPFQVLEILTPNRYLSICSFIGKHIIYLCHNSQYYLPNMKYSHLHSATIYPWEAIGWKGFFFGKGIDMTWLCRWKSSEVLQYLDVNLKRDSRVTIEGNQADNLVAHIFDSGGLSIENIRNGKPQFAFSQFHNTLMILSIEGGIVRYCRRENQFVMSKIKFFLAFIFYTGELEDWVQKENTL